MSKTLTLQLDDETYQLFSMPESEPSQLQLAVEEAERGIAQGRWVEHAEVAAKLKRWAQ